MNVSNAIRIDLNRPRKETVHLGQSDSVREIVIAFLKDGVPFDPTGGSDSVKGSVKYIKSNGLGGEYGSDGSYVVKSLYESNVFTVKIATEAVNVPGFVDLFVKFKNGAEVLHSFPITLNVVRNDPAGADPSQPFYDSFLQKGDQIPKSSEMTQAVGVDEDGKLWVTPGGGGGSDPVIVTVTSGVSSVSYSDIAAYHANGRIIRLIDSVGLEYDLLTIDSAHSIAVFYNAVNATNSLLYNTVSISGTTATPSSMHAYVKPQGGIPATDLAFTPYVKPSGGIPSTDMASAVQTSLGKADSAYQKPGAGIPDSDLAIYETTISYSGSAWQSNHSFSDILDAYNYEKQLRFYNGNTQLTPMEFKDTYITLAGVYPSSGRAILRLFIITSSGVGMNEYPIGNVFEPTVVEVTGNTPTIALAEDNTIYDLTGTGITSITITARDTNAAFSVIFDTPAGSTPPTFTYPTANMYMPDDFALDVFRHYEINVDSRGFAAAVSWSYD